MNYLDSPKGIGSSFDLLWYLLNIKMPAGMFSFTSIQCTFRSLSLALDLLATTSGWFRWAGNTLNLQTLRVTCPVLRGPAHNCDDLFPLSELKGMPSAFLLHFSSFFRPTYVLSSFSHELSLLSLAWPHMHPNVWLMYVHLCFYECRLVNASACLHACSFLASAACQHGCVLPCQMFYAPGDGTTPQGLAQTTRRGSISCSGWVHCPAVTGLVESAMSDAAGSPARSGSWSSTMNLSVTCRLSLSVLPQHSQEHPTPLCCCLLLDHKEMKVFDCISSVTKWPGSVMFFWMNSN